MKQLEDLKTKKAHLEEALHYTKLALASEEYAKPFSFINQNNVKPSEFSSEALRQIIDTTTTRSMGFDPDLVCQHIEKEVLNQFNKIVTDKLEGKSIPQLMAMKHELELFMLNERLAGHGASLEKTNMEIAGLEASAAPVPELSEDDISNRVAKIGPKKKK